MAKGDQGYIYFFAYKHGDGPSMIKIGFSTDVDARRYNLQTALPEDLEVIAVYRGTKQDEKAIHKRLASHRAKREWFNYTDEVDEFIYDLLDAYSLLQRDGDDGEEYEPTIAECMAFSDAPAIVNAMACPMTDEIRAAFNRMTSLTTPA